MTHAREILATHPRGPAIEAEVLVAGIDACFDCAQTCTADGDADLAEDDVKTMIRCIRLCLDCADVCIATGRSSVGRLRQASIEAAAKLLSGHARRSRDGGGDTTLARQLLGDMRESGQPPPPESAPRSGHHHRARMTLSSRMSPDPLKTALSEFTVVA